MNVRTLGRSRRGCQIEKVARIRAKMCDIRNFKRRTVADIARREVRKPLTVRAGGEARAQKGADGIPIRARGPLTGAPGAPPVGRG